VHQQRAEHASASSVRVVDVTLALVTVSDLKQCVVVIGCLWE